MNNLRIRLIDEFYKEKVKYVKLQDYVSAAMFRDMEKFLLNSDDFNKFIEYIKNLKYDEDDRVSPYVGIIIPIIRKIKLKKIENL